MTVNISTQEESRKKLSEALKAEMEKASISVAELSQLTKIRPDLIENLVLGKIDLLPGEIFGLGFVRSFCKVLKIPENDIVALYRACWDSRATFETSKDDSIRRSHVRNPILKSNASKSKINTKYIAVGSIIAVILASLYFFMNKKSSDNVIKSAESSGGSVEPQEKTMNDKGISGESEIDTNSDSIVDTSEIDETETVVINNEPTDTELSDEDVETGTDNLKATEDQAPSPELAQKSDNNRILKEKKLSGLEGKLTVIVTKPVKIKIKNNQDKYETKDLQPDTYHFDVLDKTDLLIYDASAVEVLYAGRSLGRLGGEGRVRRLNFVNKF